MKPIQLLPPSKELEIKNYISRHYLKETIPVIISGIRHHYKVEMTAAEIAAIASRLMQGMAIRAHFARFSNRATA